MGAPAVRACLGWRLLALHDHAFFGEKGLIKRHDHTVFPKECVIMAGGDRSRRLCGGDHVWFGEADVIMPHDYVCFPEPDAIMPLPAARCPLPAARCPLPAARGVGATPCMIVLVPGSRPYRGRV
ncbi:hypothetical protein F4553_001108 [Allocatelliglobosispora scoriae]|uniref:Uncharacterized protein n=1 Tax=Allocatelliglobosispora scoriae TaxID=643052 RepID=A0A841BKL2_9ACTN|nr:hypothetical protein [Allocatelliglobosispora scoriae]MBB5867729.1 hypothetical protein [Allocatelliglobosispora scoriae]